MSKHPPDKTTDHYSRVSGGGGEHDVHHTHDAEGKAGHQPEQGHHPHGHGAETPRGRQSEFSVSRQGMNQESQHNKHNDGGQSGHKPQQHTTAEQKQD